MTAAKKLKDCCILVVDDEQDFRDVLTFEFQRKGAKVLTAANGRDAFEIVKNEQVDVIISDICMPNGDGVELLDKTRAWHVEVPVVLLVTGFSELSTEDAFNKGAQALLAKPFKRAVLEETIERLLMPPSERWSTAIAGANTHLDVRVRFSGIQEAIQAKVLNIGRGGMFVHLEEPPFPNVNDAVEFSIHLQGGSDLNGTGIVRWGRTKKTADLPSGCGIEFTYVGDAQRDAIIQIIEASQSKAYIPKA